MSSDIEELAREGMSQFTAPMRVSPDLAARACARHRRRIRLAAGRCGRPGGVAWPRSRRGVCDLSLAGWGPDWYGDAAVSWFNPLFSGPASYPPQGSNFGFYNNQSVTALIARDASAASASAAATIWAQADQAVMKDAPFYPIVNPNQPLYHASYVHNAVYIPAIQQFDPTNVWLSTPG